MNRSSRVVQMLLLILIPISVLKLTGCMEGGDPGARLPSQSQEGYQFCFWNVENFFDDRDDGRTGRGDKQWDQRFSQNPEQLREKVRHLGDVILSMNNGRGPDILALAEVEGERAAIILKEHLNARLKDRADHYQYLAYKDPKGSLHIANAVISRVPVISGSSKVLKKRYRILATRLGTKANPLVVVASHWSSRVSDKTGATRAKYAKQIYGHFNGLYRSNPKVDYLVCGDFNDNPSDASIREHLRAVADPNEARQLADGLPRMLNPFAELHDESSSGTLYYSGWHLFDQIGVSPGMLDKEGWSYIPGSARIENLKIMGNPRSRPPGKPRSFSSKTKEGYGYSDHFPVTVRIKYHE